MANLKDEKPSKNFEDLTDPVIQRAVRLIEQYLFKHGVTESDREVNWVPVGKNNKLPEGLPHEFPDTGNVYYRWTPDEYNALQKGVDPTHLLIQRAYQKALQRSGFVK